MGYIHRSTQTHYFCFVSLSLSLSVTLTSLARAELTSTMWRKVSTFGELTGDAGRVSSRSRLDCAAHCESNFDCAAFVHNVSTGTCHMLPQVSDVTCSRQEVTLFTYKGGNCAIDRAPDVNGTVTKWTYTVTSLEGDVTCHADFLNVPSSVTVICALQSGTWTTKGRCAQRVWREPPLALFPISLPTSPSTGWTVCVEGVPTDFIRFTIELLSYTNINLSLHADFRFNCCMQTYSILTNYRDVGTWGANFVNVFFNTADSFPFVVDRPFSLRIKSASGGLYQIYQNSTLLISMAQSPQLPPSSVTHLVVRNNVNVTKVDLFCPD